MLDIRRANGGDGIVCEVIKYITKSVRFTDNPDAVEEFLAAVRNVRTTQAFGTYYRWRLEEEEMKVPVTKEARLENGELGEVVKESKTFLRCGCGKNDFQMIGIFRSSQVSLQGDGTWIVTHRHLRQRCREHPSPLEKDPNEWQ